jgi:hypothetical protein
MHTPGFWEPVPVEQMMPWRPPGATGSIITTPLDGGGGRGRGMSGMPGGGGYMMPQRPRQRIDGRARPSSTAVSPGLEQNYAMQSRDEFGERRFQSAFSDGPNDPTDSAESVGRNMRRLGDSTLPGGGMRPRPMADGGVMRPGERIKLHPGEMILPLDGTEPVLTDDLGVDDITASKSALVLNAKQVRDAQKLQEGDGITDLGGGRRVMSNRYGQGVAVPRSDSARVKVFNDPQGEGQLDMERNVANRPNAPFYKPDIIDGPWSNGKLPNDPKAVRDYINVVAGNYAPAAAAVQKGIADFAPFAEAARVPRGVGALMRPPASQSAAPAAPDAPDAFADPRYRNTGAGPAGMFSPADMMEVQGEAMRFARTPSGRQQMGQWLMNQPDTTLRTQDVPGTAYTVPMVGNRAMGTVPKLPGAADQGRGQGIRVVTAEDGTKFYFGPDGKVINPGSGVGSDGRALSKGADKAEEDLVFKIDPDTKEPILKAVPRLKSGKIHPALAAAGWQRYADADGDGVPDAVQAAGAAPAATGGWKAAFEARQKQLSK